MHCEWVKAKKWMPATFDHQGVVGHLFKYGHLRVLEHSYCSAYGLHVCKATLSVFGDEVECADTWMLCEIKICGEIVTL